MLCSIPLSRGGRSGLPLQSAVTRPHVEKLACWVKTLRQSPNGTPCWPWPAGPFAQNRLVCLLGTSAVCSSHYGLQPRLGTGTLLDAPRAGPLTTSQKPRVTATQEEMRAIKEEKLRHHASLAALRSQTRPKGLAAQQNATRAARERASGWVPRAPGVSAALHRQPPTEMQLPQLPHQLTLIPQQRGLPLDLNRRPCEWGDTGRQRPSAR